MSNEIVIPINGFPLIKFQKRHRIEEFQKGKMYMNCLEYYRELERTTHNSSVGDLFEAMIHVNDGFIVFEGEGVMKLSDALIHTSVSNCFVFCMFGIAPHSEYFQFTEDQKNEILKLGDTALLITDQHEFFRRVDAAIERNKLKGEHRFVKYYDEAQDSAEYWSMLLTRGMSQAAFAKRKMYSPQQEYRFMIDPTATEDDHYELDIGSIADISVILPAQKALEITATFNES